MRYFKVIVFEPTGGVRLAQPCQSKSLIIVRNL